DPTAIEVIVTDHFKFAFVTAMHVGIGNFLPLDVSVQFFLPILETDGEISRSFGPPKEIEIIAKTLMLIELGDGTEKAVLPLESDRCLLRNAGRLGTGRGAGGLSPRLCIRLCIFLL